MCNFQKKLQKLMMKYNVIFNEVVAKLVFMECAVCVERNIVYRLKMLQQHVTQ
jgi:hypothetical protein